MATIDNNFRKGYIVRINWWVNWQSVESNCTNITVQAQFVSTGSSYNIRANATKYGYLNIDGTTYSFTFNASNSGGQTKTYFEKTVNIYHNSDGTRSCYIGLDLGINVTLSGKYWGTVSTSGTVNFSTIPRKSTITGISGDWMGSNMTVNIDRKSSSFTTSVWVRAGGCDWQCVVWKQGGNSFTFNLPIGLANYVTQATECTGQVLIRTYNGDSEIGDDMWDKWMGIPDNIKPAITNVQLDTDTQVNGGWIWVQNKSKLRVRTTANGSYGSWITSVRVTYDGNNYWGTDIWTNTMHYDGARGVNVTVWDSRGRTATWSGTANVQWYGNPWGSLSAYRCDANGNRDDINGEHVRVIYSGDKAYLAGYNTFSLKVDHRVQGGDWVSHNDVQITSPVGDTSIILNYGGEKFSLEKSYEIRLRVSDWYTTTTKLVPIGTAFVLMDFKAGGKGLSIGKVCEREAFEVNMDYYLGGNMRFNKGGFETTISHSNSPAYLFFHNSGDSSGNGNIGLYHSGVGSGWEYNTSSQQLLLKSGYGTTSDERLKYDFDEFTDWDNYYNFYMDLKPLTFKYNEDMRNETHIGMKAQEVAESIVENNLNNDKLCIVKCIENKDMEDGREYNLAYQEFIPLNIKMIQKHEKEIQQLNNIIAQQQEQINQLISEKGAE